MKQTFALILSFLLLCFVPNADGGTIAGQIQTATGGSITNGTLTFTLSQGAVLAGTASIATQQVSCYTDNFGNIVGLPDPIVAPILSSNLSSGTLPAGTYYVVIAYYVGSTLSNVSPEAQLNLSSQGTLIVQQPVLQPASATGYKVYIGATSGSETLQGAVSSWIGYSQSTSLISGSAKPASNTTTCSITFSDQLIPVGTHYTVNFINRNGSKIAGFPQTWCTYGGAAGTINVSNGAPTGNCGYNGVFYPTPVWTLPPLQGAQSVLGPLQVQSLTCTGMPCGTGGGNFASPPPIGNVTPNTGAFTTLGATSVATANGSVAGQYAMFAGTAAAIPTGGVGLTVPSSVTGYQILFPAAAASGFLYNSNTSNVVTESFITPVGTKCYPYMGSGGTGCDTGLGNFASPPPIGSTTPNTGAFTTLTASVQFGLYQTISVSTPPTNGIGFKAPSSVATGYNFVLPGAGSSGLLYNALSGTTITQSFIAPSGAKCYPFMGSGGTGCDNPPGTGNVTTSGFATAIHLTQGNGTSTGVEDSSIQLISFGGGGGAYQLIGSPNSSNISLGTGNAVTLTNVQVGLSAGQVAKLILAGSVAEAVPATTSDTDIPIWVFVGTSGLGGAYGELAEAGIANCTFSNSTTAGDYVIASTGTAGDCADSSVSSFTAAPPAGKCTVGIVTGTGASGTHQVLIRNSCQ